tara:strand:- start:3088 stop:3480 length:393 start_codon:yes stop_codon:yes gene_type:complete
MRKKAMNYVSKVTELSTEKVELGNMGALKGAVLILKNVESNADRFFQDLVDKVDRSIQSWKAMNKHRNELYNYVYREVDGILRTFDSNAKELGVKPDSIPEYKEVVKLRKTAIEVIKLLDRIKVPKEPLA